MKKVYIAPHTEATELIANTVLMASPGNGFISTGEPVSGKYGD